MDHLLVAAGFSISVVGNRLIVSDSRTDRTMDVSNGATGPTVILVPNQGHVVDASKKLFVVPVEGIPELKPNGRDVHSFRRGYTIMVECDCPFFIVDEVAEFYTAAFAAPDAIDGRVRSLKLSVPAVSYNFLHGQNNFEEAVASGTLEGYVLGGMKKVCSELQRSIDQSHHYPSIEYELSFDSGHDLQGVMEGGLFAAELEPRVCFAGKTAYLYWTVVQKEIQGVPALEASTRNVSASASAFQKTLVLQKKRERPWDCILDLARDMTEAIKRNSKRPRKGG